VYAAFCNKGDLGKFVPVMLMSSLPLSSLLRVVSSPCSDDFCSPAFPKQMASSSGPLGVPHLLLSFNTPGSYLYRHGFILQRQEPFASVHQVLSEEVWPPVRRRQHCYIPRWDALDAQRWSW